MCLRVNAVNFLYNLQLYYRELKRYNVASDKIGFIQKIKTG